MVHFKQLLIVFQLSENYLLVCNKPNWIILCVSLVIPVGIIFNEFSNITWINAKWRTSHNFSINIFQKFDALIWWRVIKQWTKASNSS